jgi:hypothetical protein
MTSHGLSLRLERGGGYPQAYCKAHCIPAGKAAAWQHEAHRIIEAGAGASPRLLLPGGMRRIRDFEGANTRGFLGERPKEDPGYPRFRVLA